MSSPVEDIKSRIDIVELIQSYTRLHKAGINYKANCPFHTEKTPSFFVSPARQIWHCFGCGKGGDQFKFVMEIEGHDFPEALRMLAQRAGVVLKREDPAIRSERNRLYDLCEEATKTFERNLSLTPAARAYLKKRGVAEATLQEFRIGFAPQSWDFLLKALSQKGFKKEEMEKAGLVIKSEDSTSWYDRFRSRIMFPIADVNGRVIGFSGRIFALPAEASAKEGMKSSSAKATADVAKYVNTPNTLIYDKSQALYGFNKAKQEIRTKNQVVVVEGQMDCVMSHQAGVKNAIAVSGTALTPQQLKVIRRLCDTMVSSFDTDLAGESATKRSLALASEFEFERKVVSIPTGKDPADTILENPKLWQEVVAEAQPVVEFYFKKALREGNSATADGKKKISATLLPFIAELSNEVEKAHWVGELARALNLPEEAIWKELKRGATKSYAGSYRFQERELDQSKKQPTRRDLIEERMLVLLSILREKIKPEDLENRYLVFTSAFNQELFSFLQKGQTAETANLAPQFKDGLDLLKFKGEVITQMSTNAEAEFGICIRELERECVKERLLKIGEEVNRMEKSGDQIGVTSLLNDFRTFSDKLKVLSHNV